MSDNLTLSLSPAEKAAVAWLYEVWASRDRDGVRRTFDQLQQDVEVAARQNNDLRGLGAYLAKRYGCTYLSHTKLAAAVGEVPEGKVIQILRNNAYFVVAALRDRREQEHLARQAATKETK